MSQQTLSDPPLQRFEIVLPVHDAGVPHVPAWPFLHGPPGSPVFALTGARVVFALTGARVVFALTGAGVCLRGVAVNVRVGVRVEETGLVRPMLSSGVVGQQALSEPPSQ